MIQGWISEFPQVSEEQWKSQLLKELKGDASKLTNFDEIEEISYSTYHHPENFSVSNAVANKLSIQRGFLKLDNSWLNGVEILIQDEKSANEEALKVLMSGANFLRFISKGKTNWNQVLENIGIEYIHTTFCLSNVDELNDLFSLLGDEKLKNCSFSFQSEALKNADWTEKFHSFAIPLIEIDGFSINQCGANAIQELAYVSEKAHASLVDLLNLGFTVDEASAFIHFKMGIGSNYLVEVAKFRALKILWANILKPYNPLHHCSYNCQITAQSGWVNKSLKDPYTNLLRQTTEGMSAVLGGVDRLIIQPYDTCSTEGKSDFSQRMALNISNLLNDESFFNAVCDPLGGSYAIEDLTKTLTEKAWDLLNKLDKMESNEMDKYWKTSIESKAQQRIRLLKEGEKLLIGVNKYLNPHPHNMEWSQPSTFMNMSYVRLETEVQ